MTVRLHLGPGIQIWFGRHEILSPSNPHGGIASFEPGTVAAYACGLDDLSAGYVFRAQQGSTQLPGLSSSVELLLAVTTARKLAKLGNALAFISDNTGSNIDKLSSLFWGRLGDAIARRSFAISQVESLLAIEIASHGSAAGTRNVSIRRKGAR